MLVQNLNSMIKKVKYLHFSTS